VSPVTPSRQVLQHCRHVSSNPSTWATPSITSTGRPQRQQGPATFAVRTHLAVVGGARPPVFTESSCLAIISAPKLGVPEKSPHGRRGVVTFRERSPLSALLTFRERSSFPTATPFRALINPSAEYSDIPVRQPAGRRHLHPTFSTDKPLYKLALGAFPDDDDRPVVTTPQSVVPRVKPQS